METSLTGTASEFSFVHAADLHLGSPLTGLALKDEHMARRIATASRDAFSDLVSLTIESRAAFMVIAGDVYDGDWKDNSIGLFFSREVARLERAGIRVILLKGNHDADSVISRTIVLPGSVLQFPSRAPATFRLDELKVALHGRSFPTRAVSENLALSYPQPLAGWFNIGVLHTSCTGRPGHEPYAPCTPADLAARGYHYWALGHVHEYEVVSRDPWIVFPGNLQGRSVRECGAKGAVLVTVADGEVASVERMAVDKARWAVVELPVAGALSTADVLDAVRETLAPVARESDGRMLAVRIRITGATRLHRQLASEQQQLRDDVQAMAHQVGSDIWIESVRAETSDLATPTPNFGAADLDIDAALADVAATPELSVGIERIIAEISGKLPGGPGRDDTAGLADHTALIAEARALVLGRLAAGG